MNTPPFHLAYPVSNLEKARTFFTATLGASEGRSAERWVDLNLFGHQLSLHLIDGDDINASTNAVDGDQVPTLHFGCVLDWKQWQDNYLLLLATMPPKIKKILEDSSVNIGPILEEEA